MNSNTAKFLLGFACGAALVVGGCAKNGQSSSGGPVRQLSFASAEDAAGALAYSAASGDKSYARDLFGPEVDDLSSGDADVDAYERKLFAAAINRRHELSANPDGSYDVLVGASAQPFPVPIVSYEGRWLFDTPAGLERLRDIRIGYNELRTLEALRAIHEAQRQYRSADRDNDGVNEFAPRLLSTPGERDGLYWETGPDEPNSPLGSYYIEGVAPRSSTLGYRGYFYKVLTRQGAGGGEASYLDGSGNLTGGYAVLAYPAVYGETAIMTFLMGPDGTIYQKDLGADATATAGQTITSLDRSGGGWEVTLD